MSKQVIEIQIYEYDSQEEMNKEKQKKENQQKEKIHHNVLKASLLEIEGEKRTIREWADLFGISITTLRNRIESGWDKSKLHLPPGSIRHTNPPRKKISA